MVMPGSRGFFIRLSEQWNLAIIFVLRIYVAVKHCTARMAMKLQKEIVHDLRLSTELFYNRPNIQLNETSIATQVILV